METNLRSVSESDASSIRSFLAHKDLMIHRHLDWRSPLEWLGYSPFLLIESDRGIESMLICPPDVHGVFWIRAYATRTITQLDEHFLILFNEAHRKIIEDDPQAVVASIAYLDWMKAILERYGFRTCQRVVQLRCNPGLSPEINEPKIKMGAIRQMRSSDLDKVSHIDQICFDRIWHHSFTTTQRAYEQSSYATVAEIWDDLAGFQISTSMRKRAHIARLAVLPEYRQQGIGTALITDMLRHFRKPHMREITVNTQHDNEKSLRLYKKLGFEITDESFPILLYQQ